MDGEAQTEQDDDGTGCGECAMSAKGQAKLAEAPGVFGLRSKAGLMLGKVALQVIDIGIAAGRFARKGLHGDC